MAKLFHRIGTLEAISFLLLLGIAMPLKYIVGNPVPVKIVGWIHGLLFVLYIFIAYSLAQEKKWEPKLLFLSFFAAVVPFGPIWFHRRYQSKIS